jgi:hypothetical protein
MITQVTFISCKFVQCSLERSRIAQLSEAPDGIHDSHEPRILNGTFSDCHIVDANAYGCEFHDCSVDAAPHHE